MPPVTFCKHVWRRGGGAAAISRISPDCRVAPSLPQPLPQTPQGWLQSPRNAKRTLTFVKPCCSSHWAACMLRTPWWHSTIVSASLSSSECTCGAHASNLHRAEPWGSLGARRAGAWAAGAQACTGPHRQKARTHWLSGSSLKCGRLDSSFSRSCSRRTGISALRAGRVGSSAAGLHAPRRQQPAASAPLSLAPPGGLSGQPPGHALSSPLEHR